jgi:hypothetical protein
LAFILIAIVFNTVLANRLPTVEWVFAVCHVLGVVVFVPLLAMGTITKGSDPVVDFYNSSGWSSNGLATMVGAAAPITALIGFDCSVHMGMLNHVIILGYFLTYFRLAEEAKDSSRTVPVTLLTGYTVNVALGLFAAFAW